MNTSNIIPVIKWILENGYYNTSGVWVESSTLSNAVDGEIHRSDNMVFGDKFLDSTQHTCIILPLALNKNIDGYVSSQLTQDYMHDTSMEVNVVSKQSSDYCFYVADLVEAVLLSITDPYFDSKTYNFSIFNVNRKPFSDSDTNLWRENLRFAAIGTFSTA